MLFPGPASYDPLIENPVDKILNRDPTVHMTTGRRHNPVFS